MPPPLPPRPAAAPGGRAGRAFRVAQALSYALNPLVFPPLGVALVHRHAGATALETAATFGVAALFFGLLPLACLVAMVRAGRAESLEVRDRAARPRLMWAGVACYALGAVALWQTVGGPARSVVVTFAAFLPLNTLGLLAVTRHWKISLHLAGLAGFVAVLAFVAAAPALVPAAGAPLLTPARVAALAPLLPLLMWARVRTQAHTWAQVLAGTLYGLVVPTAELAAVLWRSLGG